MALVDFGKRLLECAKLGETEEVRLLMTNGAPFTTDWLGTSPLHMAAEHGHVATAEVLLRAGISRDARTKVDRTPLHIAAQEGHIDIVELLLQHGAEVDAKDMLQMTPLHWAVERGHIAVIICLLKHNADLNVYSKFHKTPVDIAEDNCRMDILKLLQEHLINAPKDKSKGNGGKKLFVPTMSKGPLILPKPMVPFNIIKTESLEPSEVKNVVSRTVSTQNSNNNTATAASDTSSTSKSAKMTELPIFHDSISDTKNASIKSDTDVKSSPSCESDESETSEQSCTSVLATLAALAEATAPNATISTQEAVQWLEMHGITMLPSDNSTIVATALEGGQTVSLTEAGKLALTWVKEHKHFSNGSSADIPSSVHDNEVYNLPNVTTSASQLITIVTDKSQIPSIPSVISTQQSPVFVVSSHDMNSTGTESDEAPPVKKVKGQSSKRETKPATNGKIVSSNLEEERLLLQKELEKMKKQAAEYKAQLLLKEHEAEKYRLQLEQLKSSCGNL